MRAGSTICGVAVCAATLAIDAFPHKACSKVGLEKSANITWASTSSPLNSKGLQLPGEAYPLSLAFQFSSVVTVFVTLPVEFNASGRAMNILESRGILGQEELGMSRKVLSAAALTYVAAAASSVLQLLRLVLLYGGGRRRDD